MDLLKTQQAERLWNKRFVQLVSLEVLFMMGMYLTNPVISGFAVTLGASLAIAGVIAGLMSTMALLARPITGWLADKISKKVFLIISTALFGFSCFGASFATSVVVVALLRIVQGVAFAFKSAVLISLVSLSVPQSKLGQAVGWAGFAQTASMALGPLIGSQIIDTYGYRVSFAVAGILVVLSLTIAFCYKLPVGAYMGDAFESQNLDSEDSAMSMNGDNADSRAYVESVRKDGFDISQFVYLPNISISLVACFAIVPHGVVLTLILTVGDMLGISGISIYFTVYALVALFSRPIAGRLTDVYGTRFVVIPALIIEMLAAIVMAFMSSILGVIIAAIFMGLGQASAYSALQAEAVRGVPQDELGRASNTYYIGTDIGMSLGPMGGGIVLQQCGVSAMFWASCAMVALAILVLLFRLVKKGKGKE